MLQFLRTFLFCPHDFSIPPISPAYRSPSPTSLLRITQTTYLTLCVCMCVLSHVRLFETPWTVAHQVPLSMEFPRQEYWSRLPFPAPGNLPDPGIKPTSPAFSVLTSRFSTTAPPGTLPLNISQGFQFSIINMRFYPVNPPLFLFFACQ